MGESQELCQSGAHGTATDSGKMSDTRPKTFLEGRQFQDKCFHVEVKGEGAREERLRNYRQENTVIINAGQG